MTCPDPGAVLQQIKALEQEVIHEDWLCRQWWLLLPRLASGSGSKSGCCGSRATSMAQAAACGGLSAVHNRQLALRHLHHSVTGSCLPRQLMLKGCAQHGSHCQACSDAILWDPQEARQAEQSAVGSEPHVRKLSKEDADELLRNKVRFSPAQLTHTLCACTGSVQALAV